MVADHSASLEAQDNSKNEVSDTELKTVIADFLEMGHVDNIIAMFKQEPGYYDWTGEILDDERFNVRLGVSVLFEELVIQRPADTLLAIPSLVQQLKNEKPIIRGEALSVLGIINSDEALGHVRAFGDDPDPQVREIVKDILDVVS